MNPKTFDLNLLRVFDAILREGRVSSAANKLAMSQPAVSNALTRMRRLAGDRLFINTTSGMKPTPFATSVAPTIAQALHSIYTAFEGTQTFDERTSERCFTIVMSDMAQATVMPRLMSVLHASAPSIRVRVVQASGDQYPLLLQNGIADLAIGTSPIRMKSFHHEVLFPIQWKVMFRRKNGRLKLDRNGRVTASSYGEMSHISVETPGQASRHLDEELNRGHIVRNVALIVPSYMVLYEIIANTDLVATVPNTMSVLKGRSPDICFADLPLTIAPRHIFQGWHGRSSEDNGHKWLRRALLVAFSAPKNGEAS